MLGSVRVVVVDDRPLFRRGLELLLPAATGGRVHVAAGTGDAGRCAALVRDHRPDLVLVDLGLPAPGGLRAIGSIHRTEPALPVVALAAGTEHAVDALRAGARGLLPAASEPEQLVAPLLAVVDGWTVLPAPVLDGLIHTGAPTAVAGRLSDRERALWRLVAGGASTNDIALALHVSERTGKRLVAALLRQLRVSSRIEAAALAGRAGLLDRPDPVRG